MRIFESAATLMLVIGVASPLPAVETVEREVVKETTTRYSGTVSRVDPGSSTIILQSEGATAQPTTYTYNKQTTFVDDTGKTVTYEEIRNKPVTVYYTAQGDTMVVSKVEVTNRPGGVIERKETTTEIPAR